MLSIGYLALGLALLSAIFLLVFHNCPNEKPVKSVDYRNIYSQLAPKEL